MQTNVAQAAVPFIARFADTSPQQSKPELSYSSSTDGFEYVVNTKTSGNESFLWTVVKVSGDADAGEMEQSDIL